MPADKKIQMTDITDVGKKLKDIHVRISYRIINLFSGQLYQSPVKAIEELIANSYDAFASVCQVIIPDNLSKSDRIIVFDDGTSMDVDGFEKLWMIASTDKRDKESKKTITYW
jgi:DNA mismatch repair ATPase MutL